MAGKSWGQGRLGIADANISPAGVFPAELIRAFNIPLLLKNCRLHLCCALIHSIRKGGEVKRDKGSWWSGESVGRRLVLVSWITACHYYLVKALRGLCWCSGYGCREISVGMMSFTWLRHLPWSEMQRYAWLKGKAVPMDIRNIFLFLPLLHGNEAFVYERIPWGMKFRLV